MCVPKHLIRNMPKAKCFLCNIEIPCDSTMERIEELIRMRLCCYEEWAEHAPHCIQLRTNHLQLVAIAHLWRECKFRPCCVEDTVVQTTTTGAALIHEPSVDGEVHVQDFEEMVIDADGIPTKTLAVPRRHSFYCALHRMNALRFPVSHTVFPSRQALHHHGKSFVKTPWILKQKETYWTHTNMRTGRKCIHAILLKEEYEPRWGHYLCTDANESKHAFEWQEDLQTHPVPVFINLVGSASGTSFRYTGHWSFQRITSASSERIFVYVDGTFTRKCHGVFGVKLAHYDNRWGKRIIMDPIEL